MTAPSWPEERISPYGVVRDAGAFECVDCGHRYEHLARGQLPPCPRYRDATHVRAAWRGRATETFHP